jgi:hypothetical protein
MEPDRDKSDRFGPRLPRSSPEMALKLRQFIPRLLALQEEIEDITGDLDRVLLREFGRSLGDWLADPKHSEDDGPPRRKRKKKRCSKNRGQTHRVEKFCEQIEQRLDEGVRIKVERQSDNSALVTLEDVFDVKLSSGLADVLEVLCEDAAPQTDDGPVVDWKPMHRLRKRLAVLRGLGEDGAPSKTSVTSAISRLRDALWPFGFIVQTHRTDGTYRVAKQR